MKKVVSVIFFFCWLFNPAKLVSAQGIIITAYEPQNFLLKKENIIALPYAWMGNSPEELLRIKIANYEKSGIFARFARLPESDPAITMQPQIIILKKNIVNRQVFNAFYNKPKADEKELLRQAWKEAFGIDVWYPYYKAKKIERWVKKKLSIRIFKFKGEPVFQRDQVLYTLKTVF